MSQSSLLDDVRSWNKEECRHQCEAVLPKLIDFAEKDGCNLDVIQMILHNFSTACEPSKVEHLIFRRLGKKICCRYDNLFEEIRDIVSEQQIHLQEMQQKILNLLQAAVSIVEGLELCIQEALLTCAQLEICDVHSLLPTVIHVIRGSYDHCKESSSVYREQLSIVSEQLSVLFKKVHNLQMTFLNLLDKFVLTSSSPDCDLEDIAKVILGLHSIGEVATHLDIKITVTVWKAISRLSCVHKPFLRDKIDFSPILTSLCDNMTSGYDYLVQSMPLQPQEASGEEKAFMKNIKILGFQMKILVKFVDEFASDLSTECVRKIYHLIVHIQRLSPPSLESRRVAKVYVEEIQKQLTNGIGPLVKKLVGNRAFIQCMTQLQQQLDSADTSLSHCLMLLSVSEYLVTQPLDVQKLWISAEHCSQEVHRTSIIEAIFSAVKECYIELSLPVFISAALCSGQLPREVSLYEFVCTRLCTLVASWPALYFHELEKCLLQQVLQPVTHNALLAVDVWCFLARYGSAELCRDHCMFLTTLLLRDGLSCTPQCCHLLILLRRLLKFLAPQHHEGFVGQFSISEKTLPLWSVFPLHVMSGSLATNTVEAIVQYCCKDICKYTDCPSYRTAAKTLDVDICLRCLSNVTANPFVRERDLKPSHSTEMLQVCVQLLQVLQTGDLQKYTPLQKCGASLLVLMSSLVLDNVHVHMVLEMIHTVLKQFRETGVSCDVLKMASLQFIQSLTKKRFPPAPKQSEILHLLPRLFTSALSDPNPLLRTEALRVFAQFAEETAHESVVTDSLSGDPDVQQRAVTYLNKRASKMSFEPPDVEALQAELVEQREYCEMDVTSLYKPVTWPDTDNMQPSSKRIKLEGPNSFNDTELTAAVQGLKENTHRIESAFMNNNKDIPAWVVTELRYCHNVLSKLL